VRYWAWTVIFDLDLLRDRYEKELRPILGNPDREDLTLQLWRDAIEEERRRLLGSWQMPKFRVTHCVLRRAQPHPDQTGVARRRWENTTGCDSARIARTFLRDQSALYTAPVGYRAASHPDETEQYFWILDRACSLSVQNFIFETSFSLRL
jgi:hypothetical protein